MKVLSVKVFNRGLLGLTVACTLLATSCADVCETANALRADCLGLTSSTDETDVKCEKEVLAEAQCLTDHDEFFCDVLKASQPELTQTDNLYYKNCIVGDFAKVE